MTVSASGQFEIAAAGGTLLVGASTVYGLTSVGGLDAVDVDTNDMQLIGDGAYPARDRKRGRTVSLDMKIVDRSSLTASLGSLTAAFDTGTNGDAILTYRWYGQSANRYVTGRARRCAWTAKYDEYGFGYISAHVDFYCPNPTIKTSSGGTVVTF